jgi:uncharacterized protein YcnI
VRFTGRRLLAGVAALFVTALGAPAALAHVQVQPALVAPGDAVIFTVVVPNERDVATVEVELQIPEGVIPFAFEETPGWKQSERLAADQSLDVVAWTGSLPPGSFVRFFFLAGTPDEPGEITWPTVQRYADGVSARWIGPPDSEEPAAVTVVSADAARQNAGGEGGGASQPEAPPPATEPGGPAAAPAESDSGTSASWLAVAALVVAVLALVVALVGAARRPRS